MTFKYSLPAYITIAISSLCLFTYGLATNNFVVLGLITVTALAISTGKCTLTSLKEQTKGTLKNELPLNGSEPATFKPKEKK